MTLNSTVRRLSACLLPACVYLSQSVLCAAEQVDADGTSRSARTTTVAEPAPASLSVPTTPMVWQPLDDFSLTDQNGNTVTRDDLLGRPWVASFIFTSCVEFCPQITRAVKELSDRVRDPDIRYVSFSVLPNIDTPERLTEYAEVFGATDEQWMFLTGPKDEVYRLVNEGFQMFAQELFGKERKPGFEVLHTNRVVLVNPDGVPVESFVAIVDTDMVKLRRILNGTDPFPRPGESARKQFEKAIAIIPTPGWIDWMPRINASLNGIATILLLLGFRWIKRGRTELHKKTMLTAFAVSCVFLACYLVYHFALRHYTGSSSKSFQATGAVKHIYLVILVSHIILAFFVPPLAATTILKGLRGQWDSHRRFARITFPVWLYVSVTGVIIYLVVYHWPGSAIIPNA